MRVQTSEPTKWQNPSIYVQVSRSRVQDVFTWKKDGDTWSCPSLRRHFENYGEVIRAWAPWEEEDERNFARVWFREDEAAAQAIKASPHSFGKFELVCGWTRPSSDSALVDKFLWPIPEEEYRELTGFTWDDYLAPQNLKEALQRIGEDLDPKMRERRRLSRQKQFGNPNLRAPGIPIVLFHGPPGTGKTFGMKVLAAQSRLKPWILQVKGMQEGSSQTETLFGMILERIAGLEDAVVFVDECEVLFPNREVLAQYASVDVRLHQKMIASFLQWAEGLATRRCADGKQPPLLCLATNLKDHVDLAVRDRARTTVSFELPSPGQCATWWSIHAQQLSGDGRTHRCQLAVLGWLSWAAGLSFRGMWSIAETMVDRDAKRSSNPEERAGEPGFAEYAAEIISRGRQQLPSLLDAVNSSYRWTWALHNIVWLLDRLRQAAPRARL